MKTKLSKLPSEVEEKHEEMKALQKENEELTRSYHAVKEEKFLQVMWTDEDEMKQQLITTKEESEHKSQQIAAYEFRISQLTKEVEAFSSSLQEKEAAVAQLESELQSYQKRASNPKLLSDILTLTTEIAELRQMLQEAELQKQQSTLEKETAVQEVETKKKIEIQLHRHLDEPPRVTNHPKNMKDAVPGEPAAFIIQATGTEPLNYQWEHKIEEGSEEWQLCDVEMFPGANSPTLTIPSVQKSDEGSYHCTVSNLAGSETSESVTLTVAQCPEITTHPEEFKNKFPGRPVSFTVKATGTEPLNYQWQWKPVVEGVSSEKWQNLTSCGSVLGADTAALMFTSIESCREGLYRCVVSNVVGEAISEYTDHIIGKITGLRDLLNELRTVTQWYLLGIYLGLHPSTLDAIRKDYVDTEECRTQMLIEWQKCVIPTWSAVVKALVGIGRERFASHLATKYGVSFPDTDDGKTLETLEVTETKVKLATGSEPSEAIYHRDEFQQLGIRLSEIEQLLKTSRDSQVPLNENVYNLMSELTKLGKEVQKIAQDIGNIESELQQRQHDSQLLREMQMDLAHRVEKCRLLQQMITIYTEEIIRVKIKLEKKKEQLLSVQQEAQNMKTKLFKLQAELEEKHEEMKALQKENEELTRSYHAVKEEKFLQIMWTDDEMKQQLITTKEESEHKSQQIAAYEFRISQLTKEVEAFSSSLQEKEATVAQLESELPSYQKHASNPKHLSGLNALTTEIVELTQRLQEAEYQKQQASLERDAAILETKEKMFEKHPQLGSIQGVEVIGMAEFIVPTQGGCFEWKGYGLKFHVPEESLPSGMEEARVNIRASLSGQFQLPEDSDLLSPVFWISAPCKFIKPVTLEIQHCALREDERVLSDLNFVSAKHSQSNLPYRFKHLDGGVFTKHSSYGIIQLSHFCGMGVDGKKSTPRLYCAHLYHTMKHLHDWRFYLAITRDLEAQITAMKRHYSQHFARWDSTAKFRFEGSEIILETPKDGKITEGWKITPIFYPKIAKIEADEFGEGKSVPQCELMIEWKGESKTPVRLVYKVIMKGASEPDNYLHLVLDPAEAPVNRREDGAYVSREHSTNPRKPKLKELTDALYYKVDDKWKILGIHLGLEERLDSIEENCKQDSKKCLLEILRTWLKQVDPPPTWTAIIEAVEFLGEKPLGRELQQKYI